MDAVIVVDTSVIIKWFTAAREAGFERARQLLAAHRQGRMRMHVPLLALYEAGNVLLRYGDSLPPSEQIRCLTDLFFLELAIHPLNLTQALIAHELASAYHVSFYDACFVALAQDLRAPFISADERLCRQVAGLPFVHLLRTVELSS